jgi:DNA integrity scanning protein DisA with diadenylate cyclase activity
MLGSVCEIEEIEFKDYFENGEKGIEKCFEKLNNYYDSKLLKSIKRLLNYRERTSIDEIYKNLDSFKSEMIKDEE